MGKQTLRAPYLIFGACIITVFALHYYGFINMSSRDGASAAPTQLPHEQASLDQLSLRISQAGVNPSRVRIALQNTHPSAPLTILKWDTPFDENPLVLGVLTISDGATGEEVGLTRIMRNRQLPPTKAALMELRPRATVENEVSLIAPAVKLEKSKKYKIQVRGSWKAAWPCKLADVTSTDLEKMSDSERALTGNFESNEINLVVDY